MPSAPNTIHVPRQEQPAGSIRSHQRSKSSKNQSPPFLGLARENPHVRLTCPLQLGWATGAAPGAAWHADPFPPARPFPAPFMPVELFCSHFKITVCFPDTHQIADPIVRGPTVMEKPFRRPGHRQEVVTGDSICLSQDLSTICLVELEAH